jgi:hypothetical protein
MSATPTLMTKKRHRYRKAKFYRRRRTYVFHLHDVHGWCRDYGDTHDNREADYFDRATGGKLGL